VACDPMTLDECRRFYAEEIRFAANLRSDALVDAFARVPREHFLGPGPWQIAYPDVLGETTHRTVEDPRDLYHDVLIAIDPSRGLNNGHPSSLARWIEELGLREGERLFHLGCGVGYYTAVMAELVGTGGAVAASEVDSDLAARARGNLGTYGNVTVKSVDGAVIEEGSFDALFINAGVTHPHLPWLRSMNDGGRMLLPLTLSIGDAGSGLMLMISRQRDRFSARVVGPVSIYSCRSVRDPDLEPAIKRGLATRALTKVQSVRCDAHEPDDECVVHRRDVCVSARST
jgi:protein-L-isoaspartate(D-aspartate) O-methyltransferase